MRYCNRRIWTGLLINCLNFWDEACWFLSLRVFGLLSSSLLLFSQRFGRYVFCGCLSNSGTFTELRTTTFIESTGFACSETISHDWKPVLSIPVLLLACSQDWTCNLQMIVSIEAINVTLCVLLDSTEWIFGTYKLNVLTWLGLLLFMYDFLPVLIFRLF